MIFYDDIQGLEHALGDAISNENFKWDLVNGVVHVPYEISGYIYDDLKENITLAIAEYTNKTCVRFVLYIKISQEYFAFYSNGLFKRGQNSKDYFLENDFTGSYLEQKMM